MLKSSLHTPDAPKVEPKFPFLARYSRDNSYVILVAGPGRFPSSAPNTSDGLWSGTVVHAEFGSSHKIGKTSDAWAKDAFDILSEGSKVVITA